MDRFMHLGRGALRGFLFVLFSSIALPHLCSAQSLWLEREGKHVFGVEYLRPNFGIDNGYGGGSSVFVFSYRGQVFRTQRMRVEVPYAHSWREGVNADGPYTNSDNVFGNIYVAFEQHRQGWPAWMEAGIYLPITNSHWEANSVGYYTDPDRREFFMRKVTALQFLFNRRADVSNNLNVFLSLGAIAWIGFDKNYLRDGFEFFIPYALQLGFDSRYASLHAGLTGRYWLTSGSGYSFADSWTHQFGASLNFHFRAVHPGIMLRVPLSDDITSVMRSTLGIHVSVVF